MPDALGELRILDFSRVLAGPLATMVLGDLGATVTKVERPGSGDDTRSWGPPYGADGEATYFQGVNRNKSSIALDLADPADLAQARRLALEADVVVENFRPGLMARFGLDYATLSAENPGLVYCSITGFGSAPDAPTAGFDLLVQALGGLMSITGEPDGPPLKVGVALVDVIAGLFAAIGILAALEHRRDGGRGSWSRSTCSPRCSPHSSTRPPPTRSPARCRGGWGTAIPASPPTSSSRRPMASW